MDYFKFKQVLFGFSLLLCTALFGQEASCYEIKYLDYFFGGDELLDSLRPWSTTDIKQALSIDFQADRKESKVKTNFMIPIIVSQLKNYHPNCQKNLDLDTFELLEKLYFKIRSLNDSENQNKTLEERIDFIRDDFYVQVKDEEYLLEMSMTFDDGPFYGKEFSKSIKLAVIESKKTRFGRLDISKSEDQMILSCYNLQGTLIWRKSITGLEDEYVKDLSFSKEPLFYSSLATIVFFSSEGEALTLSLKNDGEFLFYFHSW